jgi:hypothetical protein
MPGPKSLHVKRLKPADGSSGIGNPNKKAAKRLAARQASVPNTGYYPIGLKTGFFRKPGSQNVNK